MDKIYILKNILNILKNNFNTVHHYSIQQAGKKYILYAHFDKNNFYKKCIGSYKIYDDAKKDLDRILNIRLDSYGT